MSPRIVVYALYVHDSPRIVVYALYVHDSPRIVVYALYVHDRCVTVQTSIYITQHVYVYTSLSVRSPRIVVYALYAHYCTHIDIHIHAMYVDSVCQYAHHALSCMHCMYIITHTYIHTYIHTHGAWAQILAPQAPETSLL